MLLFAGTSCGARGDGNAYTADTALRLGKYFGVSPELWLGLQVDYDLRLMRRARWLAIEPHIRVRQDEVGKLKL